MQPGGPPAVPPPPTSGPARPWWKRKWGIAAIVIAVVLGLGAIGNLTKSGGSAAASPNLTEPLAVASSSAIPTLESTPTVEPTEIATAEPTAQPTDSPTPEPTIEPTAAPEPLILKKSGRGDKIVKLAAQDFPTIARITGKGAGKFAVISYIGAEYDDLLVNEIGSYAGTVYVAAGVSRFKVSSSGSWTIEVRPIEAARQWDGASPITGKGDSVVTLSGGGSGITTIKNKGHSNFAVVAYALDGEYLDLLVNEIGSYNGEVLLPDQDPVLLVIGAVGGTWSLSAVSQ